MIEKLLDWFYDFSPSPNVGAWEQAHYKPWTKLEKISRFKADLRGLVMGLKW